MPQKVGCAGNIDRQTNGQKMTNEQMEVHQFRKEPSYDDLSPCQV